ncbi:MAG: nitroreductase family protein [Pseudomonadota bacterium]
MQLSPRPEVLDFLLSRRSRPAKTLTGPGPERGALEVMLRAAARSPDHGKLEPWRFVVLRGAALSRLAEATRARGLALGKDPDKLEKDVTGFERSPVVVAVVASPKPSEKIPEVEQTLSAGAVCLALLNAALASGWGANWLSSWMAYDPVFLTESLGLAQGEFVAGFLHIGTETSVPPDRPRPDLDAVVDWMDI